MSGDTGAPHTAIVTADSLAAAFQHFNITHVTASELFRFITQAGEGCEGQPAAARGAVIPVYDRHLSPSEVAQLTKDIPTTPASKWDPEETRLRLQRVVSDPVLPLCLDADARLDIIQQCKEQSRDLGVQYKGPDC